ncbi:hypothetical protein BJ878DRAFT_446312, partial [Calycina marina]
AAFDGLELIQNNSTRWNSWFHSITRALNVRERLELFSASHVPGKGSQGIANFKLDGQHWFEPERLNTPLRTSTPQLCLPRARRRPLLTGFQPWTAFFEG